MEKATFKLSSDNRFSISIPFQKSGIDTEARTVTGWATVDNEDFVGDVVTAEASKQAFSEFRGNIREQHNKTSAVGKMVDFESRDVYGPDGAIYTGIYVKVYVSKGAENTWLKVLDGTLNGFSIGGAYPENGIKKEYVADQNRYRNFITKYSMVELSLVDSPMNSLCNVVSVNKSVDGIAVLDGMLTETMIDNVFWCDADQKAFVSILDEENCLICNKSMNNVGWVERDADSGGAIKKVLDSYTNSLNKEPQTEGGFDMSNENVSEVVNTEDKKVEAVVSEVAENEPDLENVLKALDSIKDTLEKVTGEGQDREEALQKIRTAVEGVEKNVDSKLADLLDRHNKLSDEFGQLKSGLGAMEKRLDSVVEATAFKKSSDVELPEDTVLQKSKDVKKGWSGAFLPTSFDQ